LPGKGLRDFSRSKISAGRQHYVVSQAICCPAVAHKLHVDPACFKFYSELISSQLCPFIISTQRPIQATYRSHLPLLSYITTYENSAK